MTNFYENYPNLTWAQFEVCNDDKTTAFENMSRRLFSFEYLNGEIPHSNHNTPGIEVLPILEPKKPDGSKQKLISFQAKYFENKVNYSQIKESLKQAIKHYGNELDLIYLFCNKTLTTTSKSYKEIENLLKKEEIELFPISNTEVLDLVAKYEDIARYYFLPRRRLEGDCFNLVPTDVVVKFDDETGYRPCYINDNEQIVDKQLIQNLVKEKIQICKALLLEMKLDSLREELDKVFSYNLKGIPEADKLLFYKLIADLYKGNEFDLCINGLTEQYKCELVWLQGYYKNPVTISTYAFAGHCVEIQIMVLDKMFSSQLWDGLVTLCEEIINDNTSEIIDTVIQYYGLALFNLHQFSKATDVLAKLFKKCQKENILLYSIFAEMMNINFSWRNGNYEYRERLVELMQQLDSLKENKQYKCNENLIAMLYLETSCNLGIKEKEYLENAIQRYLSFSNKVKNESNVKYLYAFCLELNGDIETAESIYDDLDWENDTNVACRYMLCKLSKNDHNDVVTIYKKINTNAIHVRLTSLYLSALFYVDKISYEDKLKETLNNLKDNIEGICDIAFGISEVTYLQQYIVPLIKEHMDSNLENYDNLIKIQLLSILSNTEEMELVLRVLKTISQLNKLNTFVVKDIYDAAFSISSKEYNDQARILVVSNNLEATEMIADIFLEANVSRKEFLQIKYLCAGAKKKSISMLKYAKELFKITNDEEMARNIIALLFDRKETDYAAYAPYTGVLSDSKKPEHCIAVASAMLRLGNYEDADLYAYKALYYLDDTENFDIFRSYFGYYFQSHNRYYDETVLERVRGNGIVTFEEYNLREGIEPKKLTLCLDSESEFSNSNNKSMGIRHIPSNNPLYLKIQGSTINQVLTIEGVNYRITNIQSRINFAMGFIFNKISTNPDKFDGTFLVLKTEKNEDFIEQIKSITNNDEQVDALLGSYHFKNNELGLPIDLLIGGDYDRYVDAFTMLLYGKNQALYTGFPLYENEYDLKYIPTLSTLVLLSSMNMLFILEEIKNNLLIPKSYTDFFAERYSKAKDANILSPGRIVNIDNQLSMIKNDSSVIAIWEKIIDFCTACEKVEISDDERIEFSIGDINGEELIAMAQLHLIHLDSFILAKKEKATLLCDDLFFRRLATNAEIKNINFASFLRNYVDVDIAVPIIMELSKTNYLYIPFLARNEEEALELKKNILEGTLKEKYYRNIINSYKAARQKVINELFGKTDK